MMAIQSDHCVLSFIWLATCRVHGQLASEQAEEHRSSSQRHHPGHNNDIGSKSSLSFESSLIGKVSVGLECKIIVPGRRLAKEDGINFGKNE